MGLYSDLSFNSGEYIPQYVGNTLQEAKDTADTLAGRHYTNIANASALELALRQMQSQAVGKGKDYIAEKVGLVQKEIEEMAKTGAENSTSKIAALTNAFAGDEGVLASVQKGKEYAQFVDTRNKTKDAVYDKAREQAYLDATVTDPTTGKLSDLYAKPFDLRVEEGLNYMAKQDQVVAPLEADASETDLMDAYKAAKKGNPALLLPQFMQSNNYKGLSRGKVNNFLFGDPQGQITEESLQSNAGKGWLNYKDSNEYRQQKLRGLSDVQIARELQGRGEAKVFSQTEKNFIGNSAYNPDGGGEPPVPPAFVSPDLAQTIPGLELPFDVDKISTTGSITKGNVTKIAQLFEKFDNAIPTLRFDAMTSQGIPIFTGITPAKGNKLSPDQQVLQDELITVIKEFNTSRGQSKQMRLTPEQTKLMERAKDLENRLAGDDEQATQAALPYYKAAANYVSAPSGSDAEIKKWAGTEQGKAAIGRYRDEVLNQKYSSSAKAVPYSDTERTAKIAELENTLSERYIVDYNDPTKVFSLAELATGNAGSEVKEFSQAFFKNKEKIRYPGYLAPQNWVAAGTDKTGLFTKPEVIEIPVGDSGELKRYYVSNLNQPTDKEVNEKVLSGIGKSIPGIENHSNSKRISVYEPVGTNSIAELKAKYLENYPSVNNWNSIVEVKVKGLDYPVIGQNYAEVADVVAKLLGEQGSSLKTEY